MQSIPVEQETTVPTVVEGVPIPYPLRPEREPEPDYYKLGPGGEKIPVSKGEYKEYMRTHFTAHRKRIPMCNHKFVPHHEPRYRNCESCWFVFFNAHGELTRSCDEVFKKHGIEMLNRLRGPKFAKNFLKFMSTVAQWKKATEEANAKERTSRAGSDDESGPDTPTGDNNAGTEQSQTAIEG